MERFDIPTARFHGLSPRGYDVSPRCAGWVVSRKVASAGRAEESLCGRGWIGGVGGWFGVSLGKCDPLGEL